MQMRECLNILNVLPRSWRGRESACARTTAIMGRAAMKKEAASGLLQANALTSAAALGSEAEVRRLLDEGADPNGVNAYGRTAIQVVQLGNPRLVELLLQRGADPNRPDPSTGSLPTHDAAREGFLDTLRVLLRGGARFDLPDNRGRLPLDLAQESGRSSVVRYLRGLAHRSAHPGAAPGGAEEEQPRH